MADPFSIIAVTETGLRVAKTLTTLIQNLRNAPSELLALSNEIWNLRLVLEDVSDLPKDCFASDSGKMATLDALIYQSRIKLDELSALINQWGRLSQFGDSFNMGRRDRFLWLKEKGRVVKLQKEVKELRYDISMAIGTKIS